LRIKAIHIISAPSFADAVMKIIKPIVRGKMFERVSLS